MKIETTTQLLPILDLSMYESYLSPDFVFSSQREELSYENKEEIDFDLDKYKKAVCKLADKFIQENYAETLKKYGVLHIHCVSIHSPKFYRKTFCPGRVLVIRSKISSLFRPITGENLYFPPLSCL